MIGHRIMGYSSLVTGNFTQSRTHYDRAIGIYDPVVHRPLAMLFGQDGRVGILSGRALTLWFLGHPEAALTDTYDALKDAREVGQAGTLFFAFNNAIATHFLCGTYATAKALADELFTLADEKGASFWKPVGVLYQGLLFGAAGRATEAVQLLSSGLAEYRSRGQTHFTPVELSSLAKAHADLGQFDDAWRCIDEAKVVIEKTKETWFEADVHRIAGEVALKLQPNVAKAEDCFERALAVARQQQAKSWELRAAMSLARLWRDQGKVQQGRELLAPVYGWFTEGFDTRDLKEAKALLEELAA
jgi:predicted ATPase